MENSENMHIIKVVDKRYMYGQYSGDWDSTTNEPHGVGKWFKAGILKYDGGWDQGTWKGIGTTYDDAGLCPCTGNYLDGELHGFAITFAEDGETIEEECYYVYGEQMPNIKTEEEFQAKAEEIRIIKERKAAKRARRPQVTSQTFSFTLDGNSPIMSAPLIGIFPRYASIPAKMLQGCDFPDLDDDEIPTPTNLEAGKTRKDWLQWVRQHYPRNNTL